MKPVVGKGKKKHSPPVLHALLGKAQNWPLKICKFFFI